ncbi:4Fe-4S binding protein, partial [Candidatus Cryosericum odellii]
MSEKKTFLITHNGKWCKNCGICVAVCPKKVFE